VVGIAIQHLVVFKPAVTFHAFVLHLDQSWAMFSPRPPSVHWWHVLHGKLADGGDIELFKNESIFTWKGNFPVSYAKPNPLHKSMKSHRWFKYYEMLNGNANHQIVRELFGKFICREWNARHEGKKLLKNLYIFYLCEVQNLDGTRTPLDRQIIWSHVCFE